MPRHVILDNPSGSTGKITEIETTTPLAGDAAYTSAWVDISEFESIIFASKADVAGTLYAQFSNVGTEAAADPTPSQLTYKASANFNEVHRLLRTRQYFRIRYVNGSDAQSSFHVQVFSGAGGLLTSVGGSTIAQDTDALVMRTIPTNIEISSGMFAGYTAVEKFGRNSDIDVGDEDIWEGGGLYTGQPVGGSAETVSVFSASAADTSAGTGARTLTIYGLDANNALQNETITLNGTSSVASSNTYNRVFSAKVNTAGSGGQNAGIITGRHTTTTANVFFGIPATRNQTSVSSYTVPADKTLYITRIGVSMARANGSAGSANITFRCREPGGVYQSIRDLEISNSFPYSYSSNSGALVIPSLADLKFRCQSVSDANTTITAEFSGVLIDD